MDQHATNPLWEEHLERLRRLYFRQPAVQDARTRRAFMSDAELHEALTSEWTAARPGRLGRRLLADVGLCLEFFAIARAE